MLIIFSLKQNVKILDFELLDTGEIQNIKIYNAPLAHGVLRGKELTLRNLLYILQYYMGGQASLEEYLRHIKKHGFFTPYQPNLRITISERN